MRSSRNLFSRESLASIFCLAQDVASSSLRSSMRGRFSSTKMCGGSSYYYIWWTRGKVMSMSLWSHSNDQGRNELMLWCMIMTEVVGSWYITLKSWMQGELLQVAVWLHHWLYSWCWSSSVLWWTRRSAVATPHGQSGCYHPLPQILRPHHHDSEAWAFGRCSIEWGPVRARWAIQIVAELLSQFESHKIAVIQSLQMGTSFFF